MLSEFNSFFWTVYERKFERFKYARIARSDLRLNPACFFIFSRIQSLANFRTRIADLARQKRLARYFRSKRTINRILRYLSVRHVLRHGRDLFQTRQDRKARPINLHLLYFVHSPATALYVQFIIYLAFNRGSLEHVTTDQIQASLGIDRTVANGLAAWLRANVSRISKRTLRGLVFRSTRPCLRQYVRGAGAGDSASAGGRSYFVPPPDLSLLKRDLSSLFLTGTDPPGPGQNQNAEENGFAQPVSRIMPLALSAVLGMRDHGSAVSPGQRENAKAMPKREQLARLKELSREKIESMSNRELLLMFLPDEQKKFFFVPA